MLGDGQTLLKLFAGQLGHTTPIGKQFNGSECGEEGHAGLRKGKLSTSPWFRRAGMDVSSWVDPHKGKRPNKTLCRLGQNTILQSYASLLGFPMPKKRDGIMTVRIPTDEKAQLQAIADNTDITLSDAVVTAVKDFIKANPPSKRSRSMW